MKLVSNKETKTIFLSNQKVFNFEDRLNIILSPEFYWVRVFEIPVKTKKEALTFLPTLFEECIDNIDGLSFQVIKISENRFLSFAYDNKVIFEAIKKANISTSVINGIYFAQTEFTSFKSFEIDNKKYFYTDENILVNIPNKFLDTKDNLTNKLNELKLTQNKVNIKLYNPLLSNKYLYLSYFVLVILTVLNLSKIYIYNSEIDKLNSLIEKNKELSNLPKSMIQTKSILSKYDTTVNKEIKKREALSYVLSNKKFKIKSITIDNNKVVVEYLTADKKLIENYISKNYKIVENNSYGLGLIVSFVI